MKILVTMLIALLPLLSNAAQLNLTPENTVTYRGEINSASATAVMLELQRLSDERGKKDYPIYLVLDSGGGSIYAGDFFIQYMRTLKNIHTISIFSASMAAGIVEAVEGRRYITRNGVLMFHRAKGSFDGQFEEGEVESQLRLWKAIVLNMESINAARCGLPLADYKDKVKNEWRF